jgi:hypothetical protein
MYEWYKLILLIVFTSLFSICTVASCSNCVSNITYSALKSLYYSTNGKSWTWNNSKPLSTHWDFSTTNFSQPCNDDWQGITCNSNKIIKLDLTSYNLAGSLPTDIDGLIDLETLYLTSNKVNGSLPVTFGNLTNLQNVNLKTNELEGILPASLCNIASQLSLMDVTNNDVTCYASCLSSYITYIVSVENPILVDSSVVKCGSSLSPTSKPTENPTTKSSAELSLAAIVVIVVLGFFITFGLCFLFCTNIFLTPDGKLRKEAIETLPSWLIAIIQPFARRMAEDRAMETYWNSDFAAADLMLTAHAVPPGRASQPRGLELQVVSVPDPEKPNAVEMIISPSRFSTGRNSLAGYESRPSLTSASRASFLHSERMSEVS